MIKRIESENAEGKDFGKLIRRIEADIKKRYRPCIVREIKTKKQKSISQA